MGLEQEHQICIRHQSHSLNYLINTCPELFDDPDIKKNAEKAIDIIMKKGGFFNFKGRKYTKKTQANFQKIKTMEKKKED